MSRATIGVVKIKRPISQDLIAYRVVAVTPNKARWNQRKKMYVTSFAKKYIIAQEGDFYGIPKIEELEKFLTKLKEWHKIERFTFENFE